MCFRVAFLALSLFALLPGCGDGGSGVATSTSAMTSAAPPQTTAATTAPAVAPTATANAVTTPMPPRPVPLGSSGPIQPTAPAEQQMMAITYTLAMVQPRGNDPLTVDKSYLDDILKKLEGAIRSTDKGKTPPNPAKGARGNRKIEMDMGKGCTDKLPSSLLQRAGSSLKGAYEAGVLVVSCHDDKWECHQSTRDPKDVLCHAAPRR